MFSRDFVLFDEVWEEGGHSLVHLGRMASLVQELVWRRIESTVTNSCSKSQGDYLAYDGKYGNEFTVR